MVQSMACSPSRAKSRSVARVLTRVMRLLEKLREIVPRARWAELGSISAPAVAVGTNISLVGRRPLCARYVFTADTHQWQRRTSSARACTRAGDRWLSTRCRRRDPSPADLQRPRTARSSSSGGPGRRGDSRVCKGVRGVFGCGSVSIQGRSNFRALNAAGKATATAPS
jgi:hypothetical protein